MSKRGIYLAHGVYVKHYPWGWVILMWLGIPTLLVLCALMG